MVSRIRRKPGYVPDTPLQDNFEQLGLQAWVSLSIAEITIAAVPSRPRLRLHRAVRARGEGMPNATASDLIDQHLRKMSLSLVLVVNLDLNPAGCLEYMRLEPVCPGTFKPQINAVLPDVQFS